MKKLIYTLLLITASVSPLKAQWLQVGNTLQRTADGKSYRFSLGSPGFAYCYTKAQIDSLLGGLNYIKNQNITKQSGGFSTSYGQLDSLNIQTNASPLRGFVLKPWISSGPGNRLSFYSYGNIASVPVYTEVLRLKSGGGAIAIAGANNDSPGWMTYDYDYSHHPNLTYYFGGKNGNGYLGSLNAVINNWVTGGTPAMQWDSVGNVTISQASKTFTINGSAQYNIAKNIGVLGFLYKQKADSLYAPKASGLGYVPYSGSTTDVDLVTNGHGLYAEFAEVGHSSSSGSGIDAALFYNNAATGTGIGIQAGDATHYALSIEPYNLGGVKASIYGDGHAVFNSSITAASFIKAGGTSSQYLMADGSVSTGGGTVTGGVINWPGTIYSTPTTATVVSGNLTFAPTLTSQTTNTFLAAPNGSSGYPSFRSIVGADIPTLNQNTTGNAATATALQTGRTINGITFDGTSNITLPTITNTLSQQTSANFNIDGSGTAAQFNVISPAGTPSSGIALGSSVANKLSVKGISGFGVNLDMTALTATRNVTVQNKAYTIAGTTDNISEFTNDAGYLTSSTGVSSFNTRVGAVIPVAGDYASLTETLTNKTISGSSNTLSNIANAALTNSAITINGVSTSLGGSYTANNLTATDATLTFSGSYNGSTARTVGVNLANNFLWTGTHTIGGITQSAGTWYTSNAVSGEMLKSNTTNNRTSLALVPNGTSNIADTWWFTSSDVNTNYSALVVGYETGSSSWGWNSASAGTGTPKAIYFNATNGQSKATANVVINTDGTTSFGNTLKTVAGTSSLAPVNFATGADKTTGLTSGDMWYTAPTFKYYNGSGTRIFVTANNAAAGNGQIPIGNVTDFTIANLTAGSGINITNASGSITVAASVSHTIFTPATGGTVNLVNNQYNIVNPSGALATLTVNFPSSPANNDRVEIKFTQAITAITYSNGTVVDGITAPTAGGYYKYTYDSGTTSWY